MMYECTDPKSTPQHCPSRANGTCPLDQAMRDEEIRKDAEWRYRNKTQA